MLLVLCLGCPKPRPRIDPELQSKICRTFRFEAFQAPASAATPAPDDEIFLWRDFCFVDCPQYQVTIKGDGRVILVMLNGPVVGLESYSIDPALASRLFAEFEMLGFATRPFVRTSENITCSQTVTLKQMVGAKVTSVVSDSRVFERAHSERLQHLHALVETVARVGEHVAQCPQLGPKD